MMDIIFRTLISSYNSTDLDASTASVRYIICVLAILLMAGVMFFIFRIFHICVPSDILPWCAPTSKLSYLTLFMKAFLIVSVALDFTG